MDNIKFQKFSFLDWLKSFSKILGVFVVLFVISFTVLNFPALWMKMRYSIKGPIDTKTTWNNLKYPPVASVNNHLVIPKIGVDVPVWWNISEDDITPTLEKGVAHYQGTAVPTEIGNVFIFGHSSNYLWAPGAYKQIFALLDKLEVGDKIYVNYQNKVYAYEVTSKKVVSPDDLSVLTQPQDQQILSLMTCVPIGTNLNRLIVSAKQIGL